MHREMSGPTWSDGAREQTHSIKGGKKEREMERERGRVGGGGEATDSESKVALERRSRVGK